MVFIPVMSVSVHTANIQRMYNGHIHGFYTCNVCPRTYHKYTTVIYMVSIPVMFVPVNITNIQWSYTWYLYL